MSGLAYAFPHLWDAVASDYPLLTAHRNQVAELPQLKPYLISKRHLAFNESDLFRHYPSLDPK